MSPATSKAQWRFMQGVKGGSIKAPGLSKGKAAEFVDDTDYGDLPTRARKNAPPPLKKK